MLRRRLLLPVALFALALALPALAFEADPRFNPEQGFELVYQKIVTQFVDGATPTEVLAAGFRALVDDVTPQPEITDYIPGGTDQISPLMLRRIINDVKREHRKDEDIADLFVDVERGMVDSLGDPFSNLLVRESNERMQEMMHGDFSEISGIGVFLEEGDDRVVIRSVLLDMPAFRIGVRSGDVILTVSGEEIHTLEEARNTMRGPVGSDVQLTVRRSGVPEPITFTLTREPVAERNVKFHMVDEKVGYVRLSTFLDSHSSHDLETGLNYLRINHGAERVILDLRGNPGGLLDQAVDVSSLFLRSGRLVVSTRGRLPQHTAEMRVGRRSPFQRYPMVVLVDAGSASASEIVAGALKDQKRAMLVGATTYGKGSVQEIYQLGDGNALKLTIAHYYTPKGVCIHGTGIEPDVAVEFDEASVVAALEKYHQVSDELREQLLADAPKDATGMAERRAALREALAGLSDTERELATDPQLLAALEAVRDLPEPSVLGGL